MKRKVLAVVMAMSMAVGVWPAAAMQTEASGGDDITITVSSRYSNDNPDENYFRQKVEEFNAMDNGITVVMDNISTESDYLDKLRPSFANGDTPDVFPGIWRKPLPGLSGSRCSCGLKALSG